MNIEAVDKRVVENIDNLILNNRLPHAILLYGGSESDRRNLADYISAAFVCTDENKPCGKCSDCMKADNKSHPDIKNFDPINEDGETIFKIDVVRSVRQDAYIIPNEADSKVYILHCVDKMNVASQNAFLKILEEPPSYAKFILLCDTVAPLLDTVISRITAFHLVSEESNPASEMSEKAVEISVNIAKALIMPTELELLRLTAAFENDKELMPDVLQVLTVIFRDALIIKAGSDKTIGDYIDESRNIASKLTLSSILKLIENINELNNSIKRNSNKSLLCTRFSSLLRSR